MASHAQSVWCCEPTPEHVIRCVDVRHPVSAFCSAYQSPDHRSEPKLEHDPPLSAWHHPSRTRLFQATAASFDKSELSPTIQVLPQRTKDGEVKMVTVMLIGQPDCCEKARALIDEAIDNKEEKQKQRQKEYAKKRDAKVGSLPPAGARSCTTLPADTSRQAGTESVACAGDLLWCVEV